jgi:hypothetical protein
VVSWLFSRSVWSRDGIIVEQVKVRGRSKRLASTLSVSGEGVGSREE